MAADSPPPTHAGLLSWVPGHLITRIITPAAFGLTTVGKSSERIPLGPRGSCSWRRSRERAVDCPPSLRVSGEWGSPYLPARTRWYRQSMKTARGDRRGLSLQPWDWDAVDGVCLQSSAFNHSPYVPTCSFMALYLLIHFESKLFIGTLCIHPHQCHLQRLILSQIWNGIECWYSGP